MKKTKLGDDVSNDELRKALTEIQFLSQITSQYVISYRDSFIDEEAKAVYIVQELAEEGDLHKFIKRIKKQGQMIPEQVIWSIFL